MLKSFIPLAATMAMLSGGTYLAMERPEWLPVYGEQERVMVFLVGSQAGVEHVKRAVNPDRIVASTPEALALIEGRIIATNAEAVSEPLTMAGWIDHEIEIFTVAKEDHLKDARAKSGCASGSCNDADPERMEKLQALMQKETLTYGEQMFVLQAMNDGVVF